MRKVKIEKEPIELYKVLKLESLVASGGEAKQVIADGRVSVNGEVETRKRKKIFSGDIVAYGGEEILVETESQAQAPVEDAHPADPDR